MKRLMSVNAVATNACLRGLTNAYDGTPMEVRIVCASIKEARFHFLAPTTFTPFQWHASLDDLMSKVSARNGVVGLSQGPAALRCPYTGEQMALERDDGRGFRLVGGFNPWQPREDAEEFAYYAAMRDGVVDNRHPKPVTSAVKVTGVVVPEEPVRKVATEPDSDKMEAAEKFLHGLRGQAPRKRGRPRGQAKV